MNRDRDVATLRDLSQAAGLIKAFVAGIDQEAFVRDTKTQAAVQHKLLVIGEAVKRLSPEIRAENPEVPWSLIAGMRDLLIHAYDAVDLNEVWLTATRDIPEFHNKILALLPD